MFSVQQKREIADAINTILLATQHPDALAGKMRFCLEIWGADGWSWGKIQRNQNTNTRSRPGKSADQEAP